MHISKLEITGYKGFENPFAIKFNKDLTVLVGENGSGKSAIIDALRLLLLEDEYGRSGVSQSDFSRHVTLPAAAPGAEKIYLKCSFDALAENESVAFLPWLDALDPERASLSLVINNKENERGKFKRTFWGGESASGIFEWELLDAINCIYLPPLRDAEDKLNAYKGSRLSRVLKHLKTEPKEGTPHPLEKSAMEFNEQLLSEDTIQKANASIRKYLIESIGTVLGQDALIQFSEVSFDRIVERLRLLFYPKPPERDRARPREFFRELRENSLGYNNLLYLATVLAELEGLRKSETLHKMLLIEEPEAHLHPQLQIRLLQYLQEISGQEHVQVIVTTHSPVIASSVSLDAINVLTIPNGGGNPISTPLADCELEERSKFFLERWLDITRSTLLFARGVLLVEGIAEALVIPELAKFVIQDIPVNTAASTPKNLADYGVSIISLGGSFFHHFVQLFKGATENGAVGIPVRCAGLIDNDPDKDSKPTPSSPAQSKNPRIGLVAELQGNTHCRMFSNLKTFEYDLALEGNNLQLMNKVLIDLWQPEGEVKAEARKNAGTDWSTKGEDEKADAAFWLLDHIENKKGEFAQLLAYELRKEASIVSVPSYIKDAVLWSIGL
jgi:predicted ATP-dependent endonuclease of OLD family